MKMALFSQTESAPLIRFTLPIAYYHLSHITSSVNLSQLGHARAVEPYPRPCVVHMSIPAFSTGGIPTTFLMLSFHLILGLSLKVS